MRRLSYTLLAVGVGLLLWAYLPWLNKFPSESNSGRDMQYLMTAIAGWAISLAGYLGLIISIAARSRAS